MKNTVRPSRFSFALLFGIVSTLLLSMNAFASPSPTTTSSPGLGTSSFAVPENSIATTTRFWTAERMKAATSSDSFIISGQKQGNNLPARPTGAPASTTAAPPKQIQSTTDNSTNVPHILAAQYPFPYSEFQVTAAYTNWPYRVEGRVFFYDPQEKKSHSCSGTVLNSTNKSVVDTAGHCVVTGGSKTNWFANWSFCPAYKDGKCPLGQWTAKRLFSDTYWSDKGWSEYDFGAAAINTNQYNQKIVDVIGGAGASWNYPRNQYFTALGYPADPPFDGKRLYQCNSQYATDLNLGTGLPMMGIGCDQTGGSSGGAWYRDFSTTNGGHRNGHIDLRPNNQPKALYSPYYGNDWHDFVFNPAQNA